MGLAILLVACGGTTAPRERPDGGTGDDSHTDESFYNCSVLLSAGFPASGDPRVDGILEAALDLEDAARSSWRGLEREIRGLEEIHGVDATNDVDGVLVDELIAAIRADIEAHTLDGLRVRYVAPRCENDIDGAIRAQGVCEVRFGCDVAVVPDLAAIECSGQCRGQCDGECRGELACVVDADGTECPGLCSGSCLVSGDRCDGSCELSGASPCAGSCFGTCRVNPDDALCTGSARCHGECLGTCDGACTGSVLPPKTPDCSAAESCQGQAEAKSLVSLTCAPPKLELTFEPATSLDPARLAAFVARLGELETRGSAILRHGAHLRLLIDGDPEANVPSALLHVSSSLESLADNAPEDPFDIPPGRLPCLIPAFQEAIDVVINLRADMVEPLQMERKLVTFLTSPRPAP